MDGLAAILSEDFHRSKWTDQEVGVAIGRGIAVVPIRYGVNPYGLMGKYQGLQASGKTVSEVGDAVLSALLKNGKTRGRFISCMVEQLLASSHPFDAFEKLEILEGADEIPSEELSRIQDQAAANTVLQNDSQILQKLNALLEKHGADPVRSKSTGAQEESDIPF